MSRGGLIVYNWAAQNPEKVACIYADAPVMDFKSWPMGQGKSAGSAMDTKQLLNAYGFKNEAEALNWKKNPIDCAPTMLTKWCRLLKTQPFSNNVWRNCMHQLLLFISLEWIITRTPSTIPSLLCSSSSKLRTGRKICVCILYREMNSVRQPDGPKTRTGTA